MHAISDELGGAASKLQPISWQCQSSLFMWRAGGRERCLEMGFRQFLTVQCVAFFAFGLGFLVVPGPFLEGIYRVADAGDVGWVRMLGAALVGVGAMEAKLLSECERFVGFASSFIAVPALLTSALLWGLIEGTEVYNAFFGWSSVVVTAFFTAGHLWFGRQPQGVSTATL